ncbi:MAG: hypothetical protein A2Z69_01880 [Bacteroidetes bacterium RBG_13_44_24]|nr:MAG: hypothetical protein A2Z69_01880 [Bacteroidetes bacterium RBG_13_44_24]
MLIKLLLISTLLLALAFAFLGIRILLKPSGKFPETHISRNREMRKRGLTCAQETDIGCNPGDNFEGCSTCRERINHGVAQS